MYPCLESHYTAENVQLSQPVTTGPPGGFPHARKGIASALAIRPPDAWHFSGVNVLAQRNHASTIYPVVTGPLACAVLLWSLDVVLFLELVSQTGLSRENKNHRKEYPQRLFELDSKAKEIMCGTIGGYHRSRFLVEFRGRINILGEGQVTCSSEKFGEKQPRAKSSHC